MQGLEAKHTNTAPIGREVQIESMKMIWDDKSPKSVLNYVTDVISKVRAGEVPYEDLIARARLGKWLPTTDDHYSAGATNPNADPEAFDEVDKSYVNLSGNQKGAAWHNIVLANDSYPTIDRGDSFSYTFVKDGPTWIPEGGYVGFHELGQISDYTLDIDMIIEKNIIGKLDHIMYGIGLSNDMLRPKGKYDGKQLSMSDFQ
jgi:DNA polymerase elongation subunit (family B)